MEDDLLQEVAATDEARKRERASRLLDAAAIDPGPMKEGGETKKPVKTGSGMFRAGPLDTHPSTNPDPMALASDVGKGITEAPMQVAGGVADASRELLELANDADVWFAEKVGYSPALNLKDPLKSGLIVNKADPKYQAGLEAGVPEVRGPESNTGALVRGGSQFLAPFSVASKAAKGIQVTSKMGRFVKFTGLGAVVDFTAFDPYEDRMSDMLDELPTGVARPFFEWMATEDSALEGRVKNMIEGGALGGAFSGLFEMAGYVSRGRKLRAEAIRQGDTLQPPVEGGAEAVRREAVEANLSKEVDEYLGEVEKMPAESRPKPEEVSAQIDEIVQKTSEGSPEWQAAVEKGLDMSQEARMARAAEMGFDTETVFYHGTRADFDELQPSVEGSFGSGVYATTNPDIAGSYANGPTIDGARTLALHVKNGKYSDKELVYEIYQELIDAERGLTHQQLLQETQSEMIRRGYAGVKHTYSNGHTEVTVFDPSNIRSVNAAFDPEYVGGNLMGIEPLTKRVDELIGPEGVTRVRTQAETAVDEIEALPPMDARRKAEEITGVKPRSKSDAIEQVRESVGGSEKPYINTRMINGEEDLLTTIRNLADEYKGEVDPGTRTTQAVIADAKDIRDFEKLSKTRPERLTDAEQYAVREMWASSARQVRNLAEQAAVSTDPVVQYAFRRAVTMHRSIQSYAFEARAAAARNLRQWAIPVGESPEMLRTMESTLESWGGTDVSQKLAGQIASAYAGGNRQAAEQLVKKGWGTKALDVINEIGVSAKLYQPSTHLVNMGGNALLMLWENVNRGVAEGFGRLTRTGVEVGESAAMSRGMMLGVRDGLREARATLRTGEGYAGHGKIELPRQSALDPARLEMREGTLAAKGMKALSVAVQAPFRALSSADTFFKVVNERSELYAQAMRAAVREGGENADEVKRIFAGYIDEPTRPMQEAAIKAAQERTFTNPATGFTKTLMNARTQLGPAGYVMFPFIQTPANILSYALRGSPFAPSMGRFRDAWQAGGAERELAMARMATGSTMLALGYDMATNDEITGGGPPIGHPARSAWLRKNRPYSIRMGDKTVEFRRADPFGLWLGAAADLHEMFALVDWDKDVQKEADELFTAIGFSLGQSMMNKTWLTGASDIIEALADPERYGDSYMQRVLTGFIPSGIKTVSRVDDPMARETENMIQAFKAHFGLSEGLPLKRDWLGRPIDRSSGLGPVYDGISPIAVKPDRSEPIDTEILRLGWGPSKPQKRISMGGVSVSLRNRLDLYSRYIELSGQVKRGGKTMNERLNDMVSGKGREGKMYEKLSDGPEGQKVTAIRNMVTAYREAARAELIKENRDWFEEQVERRERRRDEDAARQRNQRSESAFAVPG